MAELRWGSATDEGQLRAQNEDHAHAGDGLFVVADGMGGHLAGEVASEMAVQRLDASLQPGAAHTLDELVAAVTEANTEIYTGSIDNPDQAGMGTTVTSIAVVTDAHDGEVLGVANVGDSRAYVLRHRRLRQITIDHSFVQELVAEGALTSDEARTHPRRNIVTRALGIEPTVRVDSWTMPIIRGDRFLLCSDGLVDEVHDNTITEILLAHPDDPDEAARALVDAANEAGGRDNITVVVVDVLAGDDPPDPTEEFDVVPTWADDDLDDTGETQIVTDPHDHTDGDDVVIPSRYGGGEQKAEPVTPTAEVTWAPPSGDPAQPPKRKRGASFVRFVLALGVAAVVVLAFAILAAWARSGYFVAFDDNGTVGIYQGKSVLWFEPTLEATGQFGRDQLDADSINLVIDEPNFESQGSAELFVAERLSPTTTTLPPTPTDP